MKRIRKFLVTAALVSLLFQTVSPIFLTVLTDGQDQAEHFENAILHAEKHSVIAPLILKEKEESETKEDDFRLEMIPLIDFSNQGIQLAAQHSNKITPLVYLDQIDTQPPLFKLNSALII
jgi:hypothetical protein